MTVSTTTNRITFSLSTTGATYATGFRILEDTHVEVEVIRQSDDQAVALVLDTDYTISGVGDAGGSTIDISLYETANNVSNWTTFDDGPWTLSIIRVVPYTQENDLVLTGKFNSENMEESLDKLTMLVQQNGSGVTSSLSNNLGLSFPNSEPNSTSNTIPSLEQRKGKIFGFDSVTGEPIALDLNTSGAGLQGPGTQIDGRLAIFSNTTDLLKDNSDIAESLFTVQTLVYGASVTWDADLGHTAILNLSGNTILGMDNIKAGQYYLLVQQDSTGGRQITFSGGFGNASNIALDTDSNALSVVQFVSDGTTLFPIGNSASAKAANGLVGTYQDFAYDITGVEDDIGYLKCNGQIVNRNKYADLFGVIGTSYNTTGEGGDEFRLPDLITGGRFRRASATVGTLQDDATAVNGLSDTGHTHNYQEENGIPVFQNVNVDPTTVPVQTDFADATNTTTSASANLTGDSETRPINISCMVGIKF